MKIIHYEEIGSTNDEAMRLVEAAKNCEEVDKTVIVADAQSKGKGRLGRFFYSPKQGLYFSAIYIGKIEEPGITTSIAAVCVCRAIKAICNVDCKIKWVNDLLVDGKKVCGILTEGIVRGDVLTGAVIGVGINLVLGSDTPLDLRSKIAGVISSEFATEQRTTQSVSLQDLSTLKDNLVSTIATDLFSTLGDPTKTEQALNEYKANSFLIGKTIVIHSLSGTGASFTGKVIDISKKAGLIVQFHDGSTTELKAGEVSLHDD